jgi:hypothetical protein
MLSDGDCSCCVVCVCCVVGVVAAVVDCVVDCVAVDCVAVDCVVAAVDVPENELAARAERPPVRMTPPAMAPFVIVEIRRSPASRRAMGSGVMRR